MCSVPQVGQKVVYGSHGVCLILDTEIRSISRKKVEYFVLEPVEHPGTRFYVPVQNEVAVSKLRPLLSKEELVALIRSEKASADCWIPDENHRKQHYRTLINSGDRCALIAMVQTLYRQKQIQIASGRKFHLCDENFLHDAEKLLSSEFSLVLGIPLSDIGEYIQNISEK